MNRRIRTAAVAGMFYPGTAAELTHTVDTLLADAAARIAPDAAPPKALIAPHAGYIYSGPVAASAYARLAPVAERIERVVLLGPAHRAPVRSMALSSADLWETPLGVVPVATAVRDQLAAGGVTVDDRAHQAEHSLEVHVPFLQRMLRTGWTLLPIVVGHPTVDAVADVLDQVWGGDETLVVVSTDLSHYLPYADAEVIDRRTAEAVLARSTQLQPDQACGAYPVRGLLAAARRHDLDVELVDLRNSGDTAGPRDQVVGYGAFVLR